MTVITAALGIATVVIFAGCSLITRAQIVRDLCYISGSPCDTPRHTLDLYQPAGKAWPVIIFVHGGNWDSGDKNLRAGALREREGAAVPDSLCHG